MVGIVRHKARCWNEVIQPLFERNNTGWRFPRNLSTRLRIQAGAGTVELSMSFLARKLTALTIIAATASASVLPRDIALEEHGTFDDVAKVCQSITNDPLSPNHAV